ncbi:MAG: SUMF1/EgtB/PvdO family nonheme iron enzyme [Bacteroidota bacterium]
MKKIIITLMTCCFITSVFANNITVAGSSLSNQNTANHTIEINFDVAWENSWRTYNNDSNYDGAWIFVKFRKNGTTGEFSHCHVSDLTSAANATLTTPSDSMGVFIYSSSVTNYFGNPNYTGNKLIWNYGADSVTDNDSVEIRVFAVEMVYIPTGSYWLGSIGGNEVNPFHDGNSTLPYHVMNGGPIDIGPASGQLYSALTIGNTQIPNTFPNGYNAFWIMKYECTQQQYSDFLNSIEGAQATILLNDGGGSFNFSSTWPNFSPLYPERANNIVNIPEACAFADWAGMRAMSELEFEKACRGVNIYPVSNEYAWGNTTLVNLQSVLNAGLSNESVNAPSNANSNTRITSPYYGSPTRAGIFARDTSTRVLSGATYYGVMNMSDNLYEFVIYAGNTNGQNINALTHGDGRLSPAGYSNEPTWILSAFGYRGGCFQTGGPFTNAADAKVSDRARANTTNTAYSLHKGIRLARTAP